MIMALFLIQLEHLKLQRLKILKEHEFIRYGIMVMQTMIMVDYTKLELISGQIQVGLNLSLFVALMVREMIWLFVHIIIVLE